MPRKGNELIHTRASLIHRLKDWQAASSWQTFFDIYWRLIYGVARKAGLSDAEAQDVVQETMLAVAKKMPGFNYDPAIGSFRAWLLNLTRWRITDQFRKRGIRVEDYAHSADLNTDTRIEERLVDPASQDLDALWQAEWETTLLDAAIVKVKQRLDPQKFQIFDFYVNKEWPPEKVAKAFGISVAQVYLAKHRVTELIKGEVNRLEKEVI